MAVQWIASGMENFKAKWKLRRQPIRIGWNGGTWKREDE